MKRMFKTIAAAAMLLAGVSAAKADYTMIVPQAPGNGTSVWATIIGRELEKKLGEKVIIQHIPGANDLAGPTKFQKELRFDDKTIMVAHGGNAESYLTRKVEFDYADWAPVGLMNLDIIVGRRTDQDVFSQVRFAQGSGMNPDMMAITMLICGPMQDGNIALYSACYQEKVKYVPNMSGGERRIAFQRGELNATRETTAAYKKFYEPMVAQGFAATWFKHGVLDLATGKIVDDANYHGMLFEDVYKAKWGVAPSGDFYEAYKLDKNYRDVLQKSLWVNKGNPNTEKLRQALRDMLADPESVAAIEAETGHYDWLIGEDVNKAFGILKQQTTRRALLALDLWIHEVFQQPADFKPELVAR